MALFKAPPPKKKKLPKFPKNVKQKAKPKPLPQGPSKNKVPSGGIPDWKKKAIAAAKKKADAKKKTPNWRDSTYLKQESYLKKLLADFNAKQIRSKADVATYYGQEENPGSAEVREKDKVTKVAIKAAAAKKAKSSVDSSIDAMNKNKKKKSPTPPKSDGIVARRPNPPKKAPPKKKVSAAEQHVINTTKKIAAQVAAAKKKKKPATKYKTVVVKGKVIRQAVGATHATDGLYQKELAEARLKDKVDITDDYAARGVLHSGLYAQKQGDYEKEYGKQVAETNRQKASKYADIAQENRDFLNQQELDREQARLDAVRRRAAKTGKVA